MPMRTRAPSWLVQRDSSTRNIIAPSLPSFSNASTSVATDVITSPGRIGANERLLWPPLSTRVPGSEPTPRIHGYASGWYASTQATIFVDRGPPDADAPFPRMFRKVIRSLFDGRMHDKDHVIGVYNAHNARVRETIPPERLLVYHVSDGWGPLCDFLGVPAPEGGTPKVNSREEFAAMVAGGGPGGPPGH